MGAARCCFLPKNPPMPPVDAAGFFCSSPPPIRLDCVASPNWLSTSSPLRFRDGFTSSTLNPNSSAAAYTAAVLPEPTGPHNSSPFAGMPFLETNGAYVARAILSSPSSHSSSLDSSSLPFALRRLLPPFLGKSRVGLDTPASVAKICADHAPSQSRTPFFAPPSHTNCSVAFGLYASVHIDPDAAAGPSVVFDVWTSSVVFAPHRATARVLSAASRVRRVPRAAANSPDATALAFHRPFDASTNRAASVR